MIYVGNSNIAKKISNVYVGVGGIARKIISGYIGVNGIARKLYSAMVPPGNTSWQMNTYYMAPEGHTTLSFVFRITFSYIGESSGDLTEYTDNVEANNVVIPAKSVIRAEHSDDGNLYILANNVPVYNQWIGIPFNSSIVGQTLALVAPQYAVSWP